MLSTNKAENVYKTVEIR